MCRETQNASFCVLVLTFCSIAQAGLSDPPVRNPSFESPGLGAGGTGQWADHADVWKLNANGWAYLEDGSWEIDAPDGANVMKLWSGAYLWQQIGTWSPDTVYEVGLWLGRGAATSSLEVELWGGGNPALLPTSNFGEIDATVGAVLIAGGLQTRGCPVDQDPEREQRRRGHLGRHGDCSHSAQPRPGLCSRPPQ